MVISVVVVVVVVVILVILVLVLVLVLVVVVVIIVVVLLVLLWMSADFAHGGEYPHGSRHIRQLLGQHDTRLSGVYRQRFLGGCDGRTCA